MNRAILETQRSRKGYIEKKTALPGDPF